MSLGIRWEEKITNQKENYFKNYFKEKIKKISKIEIQLSKI